MSVSRLPWPGTCGPSERGAGRSIPAYAPGGLTRLIIRPVPGPRSATPGNPYQARILSMRGLRQLARGTDLPFFCFMLLYTIRQRQ